MAIRTRPRTRSLTSQSRGYAVESLERRTLLSDPLSWSPGVNLPSPRAGAAAVSSSQGVLLLGGTSAAADPSYLLDEVANTWSTAPSIDQPRIALGAGETFHSGPVVNGDLKYASDIFIYGGSTPTQPTSTASNFNFAGLNSDDNTPPPMSTARSSFAYTADPASGDLYAIGGRGGPSNTPLASAERYDPVADAWSPIAPLPAARYAATAAPDGAGHIFVFGGDDSTGSPVPTVYRYTIATDTWDAAATPMPLPLANASAVYAFYGTIYVIGGTTTGGAAVANVESYNPVYDTWTTEAPLPEPLSSAAALEDPNGNLLVLGGDNAAGAPVSDVWTTPISPGDAVLPQPPTLNLYYNYYVWDGTPHPAYATAVGTDGITPVDGTFTFTYDGSTTPPTAPGTYALIANFTSNDPGYVNSVAQGTVIISPAQTKLTVTGGGTITYDGNPHPVSASTAGIDGVTPVPGTFSITYNGSPSAPVNGGTYAVVVNFTSADPDYSDASATTTITIPDPTIPTGVTAAGASTTSIRLSWNPVTVVPSTYNIYERHVAHSPRGSGVSITYALIASGITSTSVIIGVAPSGPGSAGHTYYVASVNIATGVTSARSAAASAAPLYAPILYGLLSSAGSIMNSSAIVHVGQTSQFTLTSYGNERPQYSVLNAPPTMSVDPITGVVTYTPAASEQGLVNVTFQATNSVGTSSLPFSFQVQGPPAIVGRYVFYNDSAFDGLDPAAAPTDDAAIATDKTALLPGQTASAANLTSCIQGINGLMIDLANKPLGTGISATDFAFDTSTDGVNWTPAPAQPTLLDRPGAGTNASDRIEIVFPDGSITDQWLRVTVLATANTGLATPDVFYFGNLVGDANGNGAVTVADVGLTKSLVGQTADLTSPADFNRNGQITVADIAIAKANVGQTLPFFTAPATPAAPTPAAAPLAIAVTAASPAAATPSTTPILKQHDDDLLGRAPRRLLHSA
jgi:N-acetylneuraminic acid mutarotase